MTLLIIIGVGIVAGGMVLVWWRLRSLTQKVKDVTRQQYDGQNELRETARQQSEALAILRLQLAQLASGKELDGTLVRTGSLYHQASADEVRQMMERHAAGTGSDLVVVDVRSQKEFLTKSRAWGQTYSVRTPGNAFPDGSPQGDKNNFSVLCPR